MKRADDQTIDRMRKGDFSAFAAHIREQLSARNKDLHTVQGETLTGRVQGEANALQVISDDLERAGLRA